MLVGSRKSIQQKENPNPGTRPLGLFMLLLLTLNACNTTKFLDVDESLLVKNTTLLKDARKMDNKRLVAYELETLYRQKSNTNLFFFIPREWFWFKTNDPSDTTKFDRWQRRVLGETPAIYNETNCIDTETAMERYLQNQGYFDADVEYAEKPGRKKIRVQYDVTPGARYLIDSNAYSSPDKRIDSILQSNRADSYLKPGTPLNAKTFELEKERITRLMRNQGYANFFSNYIAPLDADTSRQTQRANVRLKVNPPPGDSVHRNFFVGSIIVYPHYFPGIESEDKNPSRSGLEKYVLYDSLISNVRFLDTTQAFYLKPKLIMDAIKFYHGQPFQQAEVEETRQELLSWGVYKFVKIRQEQDPINPRLLNITLELTPNKRLEIGSDVEFTFTNRNISGGNTNLIGVSLRPVVRNRNVFHGAETLITQGRIGAEFNPNLGGSSRFWNTVDIGLNSDLYIPKFNDYLGLWKLAYRLPFAKEQKQEGTDLYSSLRKNAGTRISAGYNFTSFLDYYNWNIFTLSYGFDLSKGNQRRYILNHLAMDYFLPVLEPAYRDLLINQQFVLRSLERRFIISLLFREFTYRYSGTPNRFGEKVAANFSFETAGSEVWALNKVVNGFSNQQDTFQIGGVDFSQYLRMETDLRYYRQFTPRSSFVARLGIGIARPFGFSNVVPYIKQFGIGGANSIRAWPARSLGPGGFIDSLTLNARPGFNLNFFRTGDLWLEGNLEYRFNLFWRLNGALFVDAGNVWNFIEEPNTPGSTFFISDPKRESPNENLGRYDAFYKQLAIGSGFGLRVDLTYFIFRLDAGMKIRYPYRWDKVNFWNPPDRWFKNMNVNIALGLPF